ncbi:hypothetical protein [Actinomadura miaoliensis]|uniref:hypothetical protein n=1 Tax=Actinomadura miaoliensis TaxID=430685 RepID=UPI0031EDD40F
MAPTSRDGEASTFGGSAPTFGDEAGGMALEELGQWAAWQADRLAAVFGLAADDARDREFFLLAQSAKLGEEAGELQREVLGFVRYQRADKLGGFTLEPAAGEVADVMICAAILAARMGIDLDAAVRAKMAKVAFVNDTLSGG